MRKKAGPYPTEIRKGSAMPKRGDKGAKVEIEISPEGEEEQESPESGEEMDASMGKHSRKRSAKGAKHTKAPMDGEGCSCGAAKGKRKKCTCDGGCGSYKKMDSALTPHEYLAACELGIQGRSRLYIRSRLDSAQRFDLKCGKGSISQGEKCHKGVASKAQQNSGGLNMAQKTMLTGAAIAVGAAGLYALSKRPRRTVNMAPAEGGMRVSTPGSSQNPVQIKTKPSAAKASTQSTSNAPTLEDYGEAARDPAKFNEMMSGNRKPPKRGSTTMRMRRQSTGIRRPKRDSIYADGFTVDYKALVI